MVDEVIIFVRIIDSMNYLIIGGGLVVMNVIESFCEFGDLKDWIMLICDELVYF